MRRFLIICSAILVLPLFTLAITDTTNTPITRVGFHDKIKAEQKRVDKADGKLDGLVRAGNNEEVNLQVTDAIFRRINILRNEVEINVNIPTNNDKIRYLRNIEILLKDFIKKWNAHDIKPSMAPALVDKFAEVMRANIYGENMAPLIDEAPFEVGEIVANIFTDNIGAKESKIILFKKFSKLFPDQILSGLAPFVEEPFADSMVLVAMKHNPSQLYSYAQSANSKQGRLIRRMEDSRVKAVVQLSTQERALFYFPFLDDLISGKQTIEGISKVAGTTAAKYDSVGYFNLMVKTEIDYYSRLIKGDTPVAMLGANGLLDMMQRRAIQHFITPINDLHDSPNHIRFRAIEPLNAQALYYMIIFGENDLYTSSYKYSFDKLLQKLGPVPRGDSLLISVNFDKFKKFIKIAAGYNRLDEFLKTMPENSDKLMQAFVLKLETAGSLEDAVDVADSYGSIKNPAVQKSMLANIEWNLQRCIRENNERGQRIYTLLKTIFLSAEPKNNIDLSKEIGIPPIYTMDHNYLTDENGVIIEQVFFYGDSDGKTSYASYLTSFPSSDWNIVKKKEWIEIKSIKGKPILIFANLPLDNDSGKDSEAQANMISYMEEKGLKPSVVIHRGHSYHLPYTIKQLPGNAKIIMLGSCGGYQNLKDILKFAPEAHIISTKQMGTTNVNKVIIETLDNSFKSGKNIDWRQMWTGLEKTYAQASKTERETFEDYIPPQKNLGALFIKAYTRQVGDIE